MPWNLVCDPWFSWGFYKTTIIRQLTKWNESLEQEYQLTEYKQFNNSVLSEIQSTIVWHQQLYKVEFTVWTGYMYVKQLSEMLE